MSLSRSACLSSPVRCGGCRCWRIAIAPSGRPFVTDAQRSRCWLRSLSSPGRMASPDALEEDRKHHMGASARRDQRGHEVIEGESEVVDGVACDERNERVGRVGRELDSPRRALLLALDPLAHRVWVRVAESFNRLFEVDEVFYASRDLCVVGRLGHDLTLEDHARGREGPADADDQQGPHDPGAVA